MKEGWYGEEYLILFSSEEIPVVNKRYGMHEFLPSHQIVGLRGWDDFIVRDDNGSMFTVPTVPIDPDHLKSFQPPDSETALVLDNRFTQKIKWYVQPIVFDGSAEMGRNLVWISHEQHQEAVRWWNQKYWSMKRRSK